VSIPNDMASRSTRFSQAGFSRAFLRHLYVAGEILSLRLLSLHNLYFYGQLTRAARRAIEEARYGEWARATLAQMEENL